MRKLEFLAKTQDGGRKLKAGIKSISGKTDEGKNGSAKIVIGNVEIPWSQSSDQKGWLYLGSIPQEIQYYPLQFKNLGDSHGKLEKNKWISNKEESSD